MIDEYTFFLVLAIYCCAGLPKEKYIGKSLANQGRLLALCHWTCVGMVTIWQPNV